MNVIGTGLSGLVGSRITSQLSDTYTFSDISKETGYDIMDFPRIRTLITEFDSPWVFHFAAYTDVEGAEREKGKGKDSISWKVNVDATDNIVQVCQDAHKKLLYISTDYVFDGKKNSYNEGDTPHPISWYGRTKYEGEERVLRLGKNALIIRISTPYRPHPVGKIDFVHKILYRLRNNERVIAPNDQTFSPTYIDDLSKALHKLVSNTCEGIYHVSASTCLSPYEAGCEIASVYELKPDMIEKVSYEDYFRGKASPPKHGCLKHDKIDALGVKLHTFREGIEDMKIKEKVL